ncbi:putative membrane protein YlbC [Sporosarcina sp. NCCP-2716]|uniref:CAP domain-containing protein n=1 Tax=Sporosarcina sp. NCCP-2716 TaxID=2943679 RepID=UPI00203EFF1E|nr:CAP domain-containing protein [Sporosarcina sp. NCCP-2716]GKV67689.1 putative membrane protein YlbC [Sporosarcina sp. NCCP-2716]
MKRIWKVALLLVVVLAFFYFWDDGIRENDPLESPVKPGTAISGGEGSQQQAGNMAPRPVRGISTWVGQPASKLTDKMGNPDRKDLSAYGFEWWIYNTKPMIMAGVAEGTVNQIYSGDREADVYPYVNGQSSEDIYRSSLIESELEVGVGENQYTFVLNGEDVKNKMLIQYDGLFAQLYIDETGEELEGVRFIDPMTLVKQQPYDLFYKGEMVDVKKPSSDDQFAVDRALERQILDITNLYRTNHELGRLKRDYRLQVVAREHSKEMALQNYFSQDSPTSGSLSNRLELAGITVKKAGENIALNYTDAIEAVHGWLNSPAHREVLLDRDFSHIGTGVYGNYYTQNLIQETEKPAP